jgi:hypothetical protein
MTGGVKLATLLKNTLHDTSGGRGVSIDFNKGIQNDFSDDVCFNLAAD